MPEFDHARYMAAALVPVVMISAGGLLSLALYNRLAAIVARLRALLRERMHEKGGPDEEDTRHFQRMLDLEMTHVMRRARLVRGALASLMTGMMCLAGTSLVSGLSTLWSALSCVALALFVAGQVLLLIGLGLALWELALALAPVEIESRVIGSVVGRRGRRGKPPAPE